MTTEQGQEGAWYDFEAGYDPLSTAEAENATPATGATDGTAGAGGVNPPEVSGAPGESAPSDEERLAGLLESMASRRKVLLGILRLCREPVASPELEKAVDELQERNKSVFSSMTLVTLLERAGGLRHVNGDGTPYVEGADDDAEPGDVRGAQDAQDAQGARGEDGAATAGGAVSRDEGADGAGDEAGDADGVEFLEVEEPAPNFWVATEAGVAAVEADDPRSRLAQLLEDDAFYMPVYREVLEALADGPMTKPQLDSIVRAHPLTQDGRRLTGYYIDRLERVDAIEWVGSWALTGLGREALENEALYS